MTTCEAVVRTDQLTKRYRALCALDRCSLAVRRGEIFGLLGPNGAGKTTLLRLLMGYLRPSSGSASIFGLDCRRDTLRVRRQVAYLPGEVRLFRRLSGRDVLRVLSDLRGGHRFERALKTAQQLDLDVRRQVGNMSTGMRQKLALAVTFAADTPLLILDEPTSNLDPTMRRTVQRLAEQTRARGHTVLFSSHVLSEVEQVCDRVAILRDGQLVHTQVMAELRRQHRISARLHGTLPSVPSELDGQLRIQTRDGRQLIIETPGELSPLLGWLATLPLEEVRVEPLGLRAVYDTYHAP